MFNEEMDFVAKEGAFEWPKLAGKLPQPTETRSLWVDDATYYVSLPGDKRPYGYLIFHSQTKLSDEERGELGRSLSTVARLLTSALENINFRTDEALRTRLQSSRSHGSSL
jgi:hypothetical protein